MCKPKESERSVGIEYMKTSVNSIPKLAKEGMVLMLCLLLVLSACGVKETEKETPTQTETETEPEEKKREPVETLRSIHPSSINALYPVSGAQVVISWQDYGNDSTTVILADVNKDTVTCEITLEGVWDFKDQTFADGSFALCRRETNTWKFLSSSLEELGTWNVETVDGFFSYDRENYYYLRDRELYWQRVGSSENGKVELPFDLRLLELTAYDAQNGILVMQFFLSPFSSECGTAIYDMKTGEFTMLQKERYRIFFGTTGYNLLLFDNEKMGYSVTFQDEGQFLFADAGIFTDTSGDLYAIGGSSYLMGITPGHSTLYATDKQISTCPLSSFGIDGEMYSSCYLPDENVLVGATYQDGGFRLYVIDLKQMPFTEQADAAAVDSPFVVDETLAKNYWGIVSGTHVSESLQEARKYADMLEKEYGVRILLSSQCKEPAALCDRVLTLTDTMSAKEELKCVNRMLAALERSLSMYPEGFFPQFRNRAGDGGICFLLVEHIDSNYGVVGCTYDRFGWQYIALDVRQTYSLEGIVCHEIWHATENHIVNRNDMAFSIDEWDALNPEGFSYLGDATLMDPAQKWTLYVARPEDIHFVDSYACVDRKEDRARIMEYYMVHEDEARLLNQSPFIRRKLQIMCDAVRAVFDTTGWENVRWEQLK